MKRIGLPLKSLHGRQAANADASAEGIVAICADDYALSYGVSAGIIEALDAGRLTAVSVLVNGPRWPAMGRELLGHSDNADIGLHFNLTLGRPLAAMPILAPDGKLPTVGSVIRLAMRGRLPTEEIRAEIDRQLDRFQAVMERAPDFIDGHQHVHALPGVRRMLFTALAERGLANRCWLRDAGDRIDRIIRRRTNVKKAILVRGLASGFRREATERGFLLNDGFAGFSAFNPGRSYAQAFETYLSAPGRRHLVMCHPGHSDEELKAQDPVTITREQELAFLLSPRLPEILRRRGLRLVRLSQALR